MSKLLVIIEAPGKVGTFTRVLRDVVDGDFRVAATKGRLFDMPEKRPGPDHTPTYKDVREIDPSLCNDLRKKISESEHVLLMTDNDIEGEVIAYQVSMLADGCKSLLRARFNTITKESLAKALQEATDIDYGMVSSGISRRIFDYTIGKSVTPEHLAQEFGVAIGSVVSPVLDHLSSNSVPIGKAVKHFVDQDGVPWSMKIPFFPGEEEEMMTVSEYLSGISVMSVDKVSEHTSPDDFLTFTGPDALEHFSMSTNEPVAKIDQALQRLYERGEISYPRTDSYYLSPETAEQLNALAQHFGVDGFDPDFLHKKCADSRKHGRRKTQDAHEALHVTGINMPFYSPMMDLSLDDQIKVLLARSLMRAGQKDRLIKERQGRLRQDLSNSDALAYLRKYRDRIEVYHKVTYRKGFDRVQSLDETTRPLGVPIGTSLRGDVVTVKYPNDVRVIQALNNIGIGRPSTMAHHAGKVADQYLAHSGFVNKKGNMALDLTRKIVPNLLLKESQELVDFLFNNNENKELDYEARAMKALSIMGIRRKGDEGTDKAPGNDTQYGFNN